MYSLLPCSRVPVVLTYCGKKWEMVYYEIATQKRFDRNWKNFAIDNDLKLGDACVFEIVEIGNLSSFQISSLEFKSSEVVGIPSELLCCFDMYVYDFKFECMEPTAVHVTTLIFGSLLCFDMCEYLIASTKLSLSHVSSTLGIEGTCSYTHWASLGTCWPALRLPWAHVDTHIGHRWHLLASFGAAMGTCCHPRWASLCTC
ncbi:hypothetical protein Acr_07g0006130 [Actinidia rufa]|uniref:TF-B3 domain-containing protein n=1 Tax=Actinidia rufa TaxID=165716 RepID=A0A7J0EW08_9ERIC|nr:hypothetical protein Acr_07g0006130 [Actinidia rufa]